MHLSKLPAGSRVFVDANVMVYFFLRVEPFVETCKDFFPTKGQQCQQASISSRSNLFSWEG